ncbi:MAG: tRNA (guanosine(46)-N7)-methyltransferase TrmB [Pseudomonadota bacterium]
MPSAPLPETLQREAFYGRAKGRPLRDAEVQALETTSLLLSLDDCTGDLKKLFKAPVASLHMEIGFGAGEHIVHRALENPAVGFIGAEAFRNGYAKCALLAEEHKLQNLRIFPFDTRPLLDVLPSASFEALYLLYPDPWPKRRHWKRRMINDGNLKRFARLLKPLGTFYFATDWANYAAWGLSHLLRAEDFEWQAQDAADWQKPYDNWISTRYEQKAIREGRTPSYLKFIKTRA